MVETGLDGVHVLVVEDDDDDYEITRHLLSRADGIRFTVQRASGCQVALTAIASGPPDVCLVDYRLGGENGVDLIRELGRNGSDLPVIVLTGQDDRAVDVEAADAGAADYLVKGELTSTLLERTIRYAIRTHEHLRALKASEEERLHSQRMEAVGQLAGGIAHDFNNVLTVVIGFTDLALLELDRAGEKPARSYLREVKHAGEHAATLTRQLLAYSRKQMLQTCAFDVNELVTDLEKMLRRLLSDDVELVTQLDGELDPIEADPGQIEQAIMNLVINANDAMPEGGLLTIETSNLVVDDELAARHLDVQPGAYVLVSVSDSGTGMDAATLQRIFEPFYTTKEVGKGTGLGLSTVFGIVKQSGGDITVYSEPGCGTTFKIYLPRTLAAVAPTVETTAVEDLPRGTETILLVDDEEHVRAFEREALTERGYTVIEATDALDAVRLAARHIGTIDLLVTDVIMPKLGGRELSEQIVGLRPDVKTLYTSGYTTGAIVHQGLLDQEIAFLAKPLTRRTLVRKVREVLDAEGAPTATTTRTAQPRHEPVSVPSRAH